MSKFCYIHQECLGLPFLISGNKTQWHYVGKCLIFIFKSIFCFPRKEWVGYGGRLGAGSGAGSLTPPWTPGALRFQPPSCSSESEAGQEHTLPPVLYGYQDACTVGRQTLHGAISKWSQHRYFSWVWTPCLLACFEACSVLLSWTLDVLFFPGSKLSSRGLGFWRNHSSYQLLPGRVCNPVAEDLRLQR